MRRKSGETLRILANAAVALFFSLSGSLGWAACTCGSCKSDDCNVATCKLPCSDYDCGGYGCSIAGCYCRCPGEGAVNCGDYDGQSGCGGKSTCGCGMVCRSSSPPCAGSAVSCATNNPPGCSGVGCGCDPICPDGAKQCEGSGCDYNQGKGCGGAGCAPTGCSNKCRLSPLQCGGTGGCASDLAGCRLVKSCTCGSFCKAFGRPCEEPKRCLCLTNGAGEAGKRACVEKDPSQVCQCFLFGDCSGTPGSSECGCGFALLQDGLYYVEVACTAVPTSESPNIHGCQDYCAAGKPECGGDAAQCDCNCGGDKCTGGTFRRCTCSILQGCPGNYTSVCGENLPNCHVSGCTVVTWTCGLDQAGDCTCPGLQGRFCCKGCNQNASGSAAYGCRGTAEFHCNAHCQTRTQSVCSANDGMCDCTDPDEACVRNEHGGACKRCSAIGTSARCPSTGSGNRVACGDWSLQ